MVGTILQVNVSPGGIPKRPILEGMITALGIEGDQHRNLMLHGGPNKAVLLISAEIVDELISRGYPVFYGALGENLTTRGIDFKSLRIGDQLRAGGAILEITLPRFPCANLNPYGETIRAEIYDDRVFARDPSSPRWGMSGFYARVISPGPVGPGDIIAVEATLA
ncbi:MAG TPA: MOSC domain-containing protein [Bryobacteraceae bacterium]|nr:MOSC domain-containing protein [Bryobacteraceae bacterium]